MVGGRGLVIFHSRSTLLVVLLCLVLGCQSQTKKNAPGKQANHSEKSENSDVFSSPLQRAIKRGMKPGGDLAEELSNLDDYEISSRKDAQAICKALATLDGDLTPEKNQMSSPAYYLAGLFQDVESVEAPAFEVLQMEGIPHLIRIFDANIENVDEDQSSDLLFILKILAMYGTREGAERVVEAARLPLNPDSYPWHVVMDAFSGGHPQRDYVFAELSDPLPSGFLAISLLDSANSACIEGNLEEHPFDSAEGAKMLQDWLEDSDPDNFSYAHSSTAALPFISNPYRDQLLALAMDHADTGVQLEAAWAAGKLGREAGLKILARYCLDVNHSDVAQRYLAELDQEDLIPDQASEPNFQAKADFARWLAHPNELGEPPDELEVVDHRQLAWPPERELKPFWLIKYKLLDRTGLGEDDTDCGLVGSITWCFFSYQMHRRPPEDAYAIHCYWEMEYAELVEEAEVTDPSEYAGLLGQWKGNELESPVITRVVELSPKLQTPAGLIAVATARQSGKDGWVVLDGEHSQWYPKDEQPEETSEMLILKLHVGSRLLGFENKPDRKKYLTTEQKKRDPQKYIAAYEKLLNEVPNADPKQQAKLLDRGELGRYFEKYVDALVEVNQTEKSETVVKVYQRFLEIAAQTDESIHEEVYDSFGVLGGQFDLYVNSLLDLNRNSEVIDAVSIFDEFWDHNLGYGTLGGAAFKAGDWKLAEPYFLRLREGMDEYYRSETMPMLAEIQHKRGESDQAKSLLVDCMKKLVTEIKESEYNSDREMFAETFAGHRSTFLRLFPDSESDLAEQGIPEDPLQ